VRHYYFVGRFAGEKILPVPYKSAGLARAGVRGWPAEIPSASELIRGAFSGAVLISRNA